MLTCMALVDVLYRMLQKCISWKYVSAKSIPTSAALLAPGCGQQIGVISPLYTTPPTQDERQSYKVSSPNNMFHQSSI